MDTTPSHVHWHVEAAVSAALPPMRTSGAPGDHGELIEGTHGCGVNTPWAADVATWTCGFAIELHMPKDVMFEGVKSEVVAAAAPPAWTGRGAGVTEREQGDVPKEQLSMAPWLTWVPMARTVASRRPPDDDTRGGDMGRIDFPDGQGKGDLGRIVGESQDGVAGSRLAMTCLTREFRSDRPRCHC
jgi:hypothetical protein